MLLGQQPDGLWSLGSGYGLDEQLIASARCLWALRQADGPDQDSAMAVKGAASGRGAGQPVAGMRGALEVALRRPRSDEEYRAALTWALGAAERLGALVDGLLALSRVDAGQADEGRETEHVAVIAQRAASQEKAGLDAAGCTLSLDVRADPEVSVHAPLLIAAIANLLRNAARHAPRHPVTLRVEERGEHLVFIVDDEGIGVAVAEREEVYARFARGAAARGEHREGLGLGLPLAREVAHRHGGECWIEESPAGGCTAIVAVRRGANA